MTRIERPGVTLAYEVLGDRGPAVVFTHGAGMDRHGFAAQAAAVAAAGHRAVLWDLRGHGDSRLHAGVRFTADAALADLRSPAEGLERPLLVGHSLGGNLAQELVRREPGLVRGLVVVGSTWNAGPLGPLGRLGLRAAAPTLALVPASRLPGLLAGASAVTPEGRAAVEATFRRMPKQTFLDVWRATAALVHPIPGYRTPVPLALVRGAQDRTGNIASAMARWAEAEGVPETVVPGAGHVVMADDPDAVSAVVLRSL